MVLQRDTDGEVVEALKLVLGKSQDLVNGLVEIASHPRGADTGCFGFQIQDLADHACLPKQVR